MDARPLIAVAVITNGESPHFRRTANQWHAEGFEPGRNLFFCGPAQTLLAAGVALPAVIDYVDPPYYRNNFHINHKKKTACDAIAATYIFLVHDRFLPQPGLLAAMEQALADGNIDFGAVNVDNEDGTPALRPLRLKRAAGEVSLAQALEPLGRLACDAQEAEAGSLLAINGGQFFLRKSLSIHLDRPMRWMEMEDDVLSHDLRDATGLWLENVSLITLVPRRAPSSPTPGQGRIKYIVYRMFCNALASLVNAVSSGRPLQAAALDRLLRKQFLLIDPLHKMANSDVLPTSLEKIMTRARIASGGEAWSRVEKHRWGWKLTGIQGK